MNVKNAEIREWTNAVLDLVGTVHVQLVKIHVVMDALIHAITNKKEELILFFFFICYNFFIE